jgi:hypothetical protein
MDLIMNMKNVRKIFTNNLVKHASVIVNLASDRKKASSNITKHLKEIEDAINDLKWLTSAPGKNTNQQFYRFANINQLFTSLHFPYTGNYKVE